jgi:hypothetical protein
MATGFTKYSPILVEGLKNADIVKKLPPIVQKQSIPAGTQVKKGQTVVVTLISPSDTTVGQVEVANYTPPVEVANVPIGKIVEVSEAPEVDAYLKNPTDSVAQDNFIAAYNKALGTNFTKNDIAQVTLLNQNYGVAR